MALWPQGKDPFAPKEPKARTGKCVVCPGEVTEVFSKQSNRPEMIGGNHGFHYKSSGLYCTTCGLKYQHLPK